MALDDAVRVKRDLCDVTVHALLDCNKNTDVTGAFLTSQPQVFADSDRSMNRMEPSSMSAVELVPCNNSRTSVLSADRLPVAATVSLSPDDTLNNDFYYDDEFSVQFDANITECFDGVTTSLLCRSLIDNDWKCQQRQRKCHMTSSRSDSCLYHQDEYVTSYGGSQGEDDMSTSERGLISSSELSEVHVSQHRLLFTPPPEENLHPSVTRHTADVDATPSVCESMTSVDGAGGGTPLHGTVYDFTAAKRQYVLSFDPRSPTKVSSGGEESLCRSDSRTGVVGGRKTSLTVGLNAGGLTTWKQVHSVQQQINAGFTTWQRMKTLRRRESAERKASLVEWKSNSSQRSRSSECPSSPRCLNDERMICSGHLLKLYHSSRNNSPAGGLLCASFVDPPLTDRVNKVPVTPHNGFMSNADTLNRRTVSPHNRSNKGKSQQVGTASVVDRSVQCLPSSSDRCVQTSPNCRRRQVVMMADKALQTSSTADHMIQSALLLSRPLPDLDFLKQFSLSTNINIGVGRKIVGRSSECCLQNSARKSSECNIQRCSSDSRAASVNDSKPEVVCKCDSHLVSKQDGNNSVGVLSQAVKSCIGQGNGHNNSELTDSIQESPSTRLARRHHGSDSGLSNNSSSSSGIEPGSYDSASLAEQSPSCRPVPRKPPRLFTAAGAGKFVTESGNSRSLNDAIQTQSCNAVTQTNKAAQNAGHRLSLPCFSLLPQPDVIAEPTRRVEGTVNVSGSQPRSQAVCRSSGGSQLQTAACRLPVEEDMNGCQHQLNGACQVDATIMQEVEKNYQEVRLAAGTGLRRWQTTDCDLVTNVLTSGVSNKPAIPKEITTSHPTCRVLSSRNSSHMSGVEYLVSPIGHRDIDALKSTTVRRVKRKETGNIGACLHHTQSSMATLKPGKSILVRRRQRNKTKHRSWYEPLDCEMTASSGCQGESPAVSVERRVARPVSLPDATVLYAVGTIDISEDVPPQATSRPTFPCILESEKRDVDVVDCDEDDECGEQFRAKKSVSFSEKIFYHSMPSVSPLESPLCPVRPSTPLDTSHPLSVATPAESNVTEKQSDNTATFVDEVIASQRPTAVDDELPPNDFTVSPPSLSPSSSLLSSDLVDVSHKKDLVLEVMNCVELLLRHFNKDHNAVDKARLGDTVECEEVGRLVVDHLCPALHAILLDGLKPHVRSFFGKVRNSAWKVAEESIDIGEDVVLLHDLLRTVRSVKQLSTSWLYFNAFIFALLNNKALDFWLTHLHAQKSILSRHYTSTAFMSLTSSGLVAHRLFVDLMTAIQPLAQLPFRLELDFETRHMERQQRNKLQTLDCQNAVAMATGSPGTPPPMNTMSPCQSVVGPDAGSGRNGGESVDVGWRLRGALGRFSNSATQSLVLARNALQATPNTAQTTVRPPRPLSLPANLLDINDDSSTVCSDINFDSSADSVDSAGFFQRFADHMKAVTAPRDSVYRRGVTDYSFRPSPETENKSPESLPVQTPAGPALGPAPAPGPAALAAKNVEVCHPAANISFENGTRNLSSVNAVRAMRPQSMLARFGEPLVSCSLAENVNSSLRVSQSGTRSKRWSDFGMRFVGFMDKILLPDAGEKSRQGSTSSINASQSRSGSEMGSATRLCARNDTSTTSSVCRSLQQNQESSVQSSTPVRCVQTLCHCVSSDTEQLSFEKGTLLQVLSDTDGSDWLLCRHDNHTGLVHRACIKTVANNSRPLT